MLAGRDNQVVLPDRVVKMRMYELKREKQKK